ncbi:MAG: esterase-like activity of phytase family protein, partial [Paracoccaceae bacterium]
FSAMALSDDGRHAWVLNDRAFLMEAIIERDNGRITGITPLTGLQRLRASTGKQLAGRAGDSEGIALKPGGGFYVSFEGGVARVAFHANVGAKSQVLPRPKAFEKMASNGAFEALAIDRRRRLYTMPETARDKDGNIPVYIWNGSRWHQPFSLPTRNRFKPVSADFGPDGRLYLLERDFGLIGFKSRLRRWDLVNGLPRNEQILLTTGYGRFDNLEALSVWRNGNGRLVATMLSDDNFKSFQSTEFVEYLLPQ